MTPPEQEGRPSGPRRPPVSRSFSPMWLGVGVLVLMLLANGLTVFFAGEELEYSQFRSLVNESRVSDLMLSLIHI